METSRRQSLLAALPAVAALLLVTTSAPAAPPALPPLPPLLAPGAQASVQDPERVDSIRRDFPKVIERLRARQRELVAAWQAAATPAAKEEVRDQARTFVVASIITDVLPAWLGTPWLMGPGDDAVMPHEPGKRIACHKLVLAVLGNVGLPLRLTEGWRRAPALHIQRSLATARADVHRYYGVTPAELASRLLRLPRGLYLVGLNCHIGFILLADDAPPLFIHSNYVDPERGVTSERVADSQAIANSQQVGYWVTSLFQDDGAIEHWLTGEPVPFRAQ